ncbi:MAG: GTPase domain-containing protein [Crocosphaera sp.]
MITSNNSFKFVSTVAQHRHGVIVIGDRAVGKSSMLIGLAKGTENITLIEPDAQNYMMRKSNIDTGIVPGTFRMEEEFWSLSVSLPSGYKELTRQLNVIDTPGEAWSFPNWRERNPRPWQDIRQRVANSEGIIILLNPYRSIIQPNLTDDDYWNQIERFPTHKQWANQIQAWLDYLKRECRETQHIGFCINKADLFCNVERISQRYRYHSSSGTFWATYSNFVYQTYFIPAHSLIKKYNRQPNVPRLQYFITSMQNPRLLELPWLYMMPYLSHSD